jgi:hypothetical protein
MKTGTGLWIDHSKAIVVKVTDKEVETELITSEVEKQLRRTGDSILKGSFESRLVPADDSQQKAYSGNLNIYYDEVIAFIGDAESILIFGPGEAKGELKKRLVEKNLGHLISGIEAAGEMTDGQITAKVREYFAK